MKRSQLFLPTIRDVPAEAEVISHQLMLRAGLIRRVAAGVYSYLPLGHRVIQKVSQIVREEMNRAGGQELLLPALQPAELWQASGRWAVYGKDLMRLKDRHERDFCLGPTHEEVITDLVRREIRSYRQLPLNLYQIQTKFRDEIRPRFGLMRGREFIMKDAYSFDRDDAGADVSYRKMYEAYGAIFARCGLRYSAVEAESGAIGGSYSQEFMVLADTGEDAIAVCDACRYAANVERAEIGAAPASQSSDPPRPLERVETPGKTSVEAVAAYLGVPPQSVVKTLLYDVDGQVMGVLVRGDRQVNEAKLAKQLHTSGLRFADRATIERVTGGPEGFSGPIGLNNVPLLADHEVRGMSCIVVGANAADAHYVHAESERDFRVDRYGDVRMVSADDPCPRCGEPLRIVRGIEVGHVFKLGTKYSEAMGATYLDAEGREHPVVMGCYGIGVGRTAAAAVEQHHDADGIVWPLPIAPLQVMVVPVNVADHRGWETAQSIHDALEGAGVEVLLDDRDERPGVKFKDADLIGLPLRVTIGKALAQGEVELMARRARRTIKLRVDEVVPRLRQIIGGGEQALAELFAS
ncbi:MAG TPA: proline--tRNA ligase [Candidatus Tectomicrobia bacterium]|nr:proline--tRNA ligase [Candidatus Tectomicrobia bacterium]